MQNCLENLGHSLYKFQEIPSKADIYCSTNLLI